MLLSRASGDKRIMSTEKFMANPLQKTVEHDPADSTGGPQVTPVSRLPTVINTNRLVQPRPIQQPVTLQQQSQPVQLQQALVNPAALQAQAKSIQLPQGIVQGQGFQRISIPTVSGTKTVVLQSPQGGLIRPLGMNAAGSAQNPIILGGGGGAMPASAGVVRPQPTFVTSTTAGVNQQQPKVIILNGQQGTRAIRKKNNFGV